MIWWILVLVATGVSYLPTVKLLVIEQPYNDKIIISNLTLNLILVVGLVGALSPRITKKIWPKAPRWAFVITAVILGVVMVYVLKLLGMNTRI